MDRTQAVDRSADHRAPDDDPVRAAAIAVPAAAVMPAGANDPVDAVRRDAVDDRARESRNLHSRDADGHRGHKPKSFHEFLPGSDPASCGSAVTRLKYA